MYNKNNDRNKKYIRVDKRKLYRLRGKINENKRKNRGFKKNGK